MDEQKVISFRLGGERLSTLETMAKKAGMTPHEFAREALVQRLSDEGDIHRLNLKVTNLEIEMVELRKDLAVSTQAILVGAGKVSVKEAEEFVRDNLREK